MLGSARDLTPSKTTVTIADRLGGMGYPNLQQSKSAQITNGLDIKKNTYNTCQTAQNCWRRKKGRMVLNMLKKGKLMQAEEEDLAARKIQKVFRGHKSRKRVKLMSADRYMQQKKQENLEEWAALQVQRMFRGREGRLRFAARQVEVARRWKIMFDENQGRVFYYNMNTGEIRWRKPQELLELDARPQCDNCSVELAEVECGQCAEFFW